MNVLLNINKPLSIHRIKHAYPQNDNDWGYYLAGLIDADGCFNDISKHKPKLTITFHLKDISLSYKIKNFIQYGTVSKIKNKNACTYVLTNKFGFFKLIKILDNARASDYAAARTPALVSIYNQEGLGVDSGPGTETRAFKLKHNEKLRRYLLLCQYYAHSSELTQRVNSEITLSPDCVSKQAYTLPELRTDNTLAPPACNVTELPPLKGGQVMFVHKQAQAGSFNLLNNFWLAGFIDGDGSLQIKVIKRGTRPGKIEIRLQLQIELNETYKYLLDNIRLNFGGNIYYRKNLKSYYYNSTSFQVFIRFVNYLDHYSLCSNKYKEYILWRKAYFLRKDINKIIKIKEILSSLKR